MKGLKTPLLVLAATVALLAALPFGYQVVTGQPIGANTLLLTDAASGSAPAVRANGQDANISINIVPKGTGTVQVNGVPVVATSTPSFTTLTVTGASTLTGGYTSTLGLVPSLTATLKAGPLRAFHSAADAATTGTGIQTLYTYSLPANALAADGQSLHIRGEAVVAANANNKNWQIDFGATTLYSTAAVAFNNVNIRIDCELFRTGAATQKSLCQTIASTAAGGVSLTVNAGSLLTTPAETLSAPVTINWRGTTPTAAGDLTARYAYVDWYPQGQ
jgi:hypothetical protein